MPVTKRRSNSKKNFKNKKSKKSKSRKQHRTRKIKLQVGGIRPAQLEFLKRYYTIEDDTDVDRLWTNLPYDLEKQYLREQGVSSNKRNKLTYEERRGY